jgi:hypothetical protein
MQRMKLDVSEKQTSSNGGRGPSRADLENDARKGFAANPMSTDPTQRAITKVAPAPAKATSASTDEGTPVRPLSQAELRAQALTARATGNSSGAASYAPSANQAEQNRANAAKKIGSVFSSIKDAFNNFETPAERRSRLAKEEKDKRRSEYMKESGQKAKGGAIKSYAKGGSVSASSRGDGIAQRGKTRGRMF